ncbi:hypothetical protein BROUX41_001999 [Berkeleyomyces rouxiae]
MLFQNLRMLPTFMLLVGAFFVCAADLPRSDSRTCAGWSHDANYLESLLQCPLTTTHHPNLPASQTVAQSRGFNTTSSAAPLASPTGDEASSSSPPDATAESRPFMSFEQWKEEMMRKRDNEGIEIADQHAKDLPRWLDVTHKLQLSHHDEPAVRTLRPSSTKVTHTNADAQSTAAAADVLADEVKLLYHPSKDAGKTCKERFSYASFDSGATVLKTTSGAKNAKAILRENKDSYMLLECATKNKFVIIELSDDILVDTVVIANFEFFSSMVRLFRVSASDRFPVKPDKWVDLGTFEARNSRDIQAFLVENPRIYARYIRIEFLSHYGTEYYCPLSLVRIHGTTMIESWKEAESIVDEPPLIDDAAQHQAGEIPTSERVHDEHNEPVERDDSGDNIRENDDIHTLDYAAENLNLSRATEPGDSYQSPNRAFPSHIFFSAHAFECPIQAAPNNSLGARSTSGTPVPLNATTIPVPETAQNLKLSATDQNNGADSKPQAHTTVGDTGIVSSVASTTSGTSSTTTVSPEIPTESVVNTTISATTKPIESTPIRSKSSNPSPTPLVQESFFKSVSKRLQHLETNVTWSIRYLEEQSYYIQEALSKADQQQRVKLDLLLGNLNDTILEEVRMLRFQYEQIWELAAAALEAQRVQSEKEIVALGSRLNVLAEEVVFQKRMSIGQSVLLLSCLVLVIFSRSVIASPMEWTQLPPSRNVQERVEPLRKASSRSFRPIGQTSTRESYFADRLENWEEEENGVDTESEAEINAEVNNLQPNLHMSYNHSQRQQTSPPDSTAPSVCDEAMESPAPEHRSRILGTQSRLSHRASFTMPTEAVRKPLPALPEHPNRDE